MINDQWIEMLVSEDVQERKQAITQLAKSRSREALKYLAEVYRDDDDAEVRELARKGGLYIKKHLDEAAAAASAPASAAAPAPNRPAEHRPLTDADDHPAPPSQPSPRPGLSPSAVMVTWEAEKRAKEAVKTAMDYHVRGDNKRAGQYLRTALRENPHLVSDAYTISMAATIAGMDGPTAIAQFAPTEQELAALYGPKARNSALEALLAYVILVCAVLTLVGYFLFPWIDLARLTVAPEGGSETTFGEMFEEFKKGMTDAMASVTASAEAADMPISEEVTTLMAAVNALRLDLSGLDTTLVTLGLRDLTEALGFTALFEAFAAADNGDMAALTLDDEAAAAPEALDYTLALVPVVGGGVLIVGGLLLRRVRLGLWLACIGLGIVGMVPLAYFYLSAIEEALPTDTDLGFFGELRISSAVELIGLGYWMSLAAVSIVLLLPFVALLLSPPKADQNVVEQG